MSADTYEAPPHGWTCFHCGDTFSPDFAGQRAARNHFGADPGAEAACRIKGREGGLLLALRVQQAEVQRLLSVINNEDSETDRAMQRMKSEHATALRRAEEDGYARGLRDARAEATSGR